MLNNEFNQRFEQKLKEKRQELQAKQQAKAIKDEEERMRGLALQQTKENLRREAEAKQREQVVTQTSEQLSDIVQKAVARMPEQVQAHSDKLYSPTAKHIFTHSARTYVTVRRAMRAAHETTEPLRALTAQTYAKKIKPNWKPLAVIAAMIPVGISLPSSNLGSFTQTMHYQHLACAVSGEMEAADSGATQLRIRGANKKQYFFDRVNDSLYAGRGVLARDTLSLSEPLYELPQRVTVTLGSGSASFERGVRIYKADSTSVHVAEPEKRSFIKIPQTCDK